MLLNIISIQDTQMPCVKAALESAQLKIKFRHQVKGMEPFENPTYQLHFRSIFELLASASAFNLMVCQVP